MGKNECFDPVTLEYAMKRNVLEKIDERFKSFCTFYLEQIDKAIKQRCMQFSKRHKKCKFEHDDSYHESQYSSVLLRYQKTPYVWFDYGFFWGNKVKLSNGITPSKDGMDFCIYVHLHPKMMGSKTNLNKYYGNIEQYFTHPDNGYAAQANDDDNDIYFYWDIIPIDKTFKIQKITKTVVEAFDDVFKYKRDLDLFIKKIPEKKLVVPQ